MVYLFISLSIYLCIVAFYVAQEVSKELKAYVKHVVDHCIADCKPLPKIVLLCKDTRVSTEALMTYFEKRNDIRWLMNQVDGVHTIVSFNQLQLVSQTLYQA